ncbi:MAG: PIG-L family deacetylase, partial [Ruminiclostridium sp.]|nr:PIG-L family deacetylase [Ruminiclostridium sp.]
MDSLKILVVGGHPADVFDHCGGTLAHHVRRGDQITTLALTHGLRVHDIVVSEEMRFQKEKPDPERLEAIIQERTKVKYGEVIEACGILGIQDVRFLHYDDSTLLVTSELIGAVARIIRSVKPDIVVTHYPLENAGVESHHGNTGKIVLHAIQYAGAVDFQDSNHSHRVPQVFFMSPLEATFKPTSLSGSTNVFCDYYVDITDIVEQKVKALDAMKSQQYEGDFSRKSVEIGSGKDGHFMTVSYAEGFVRYYP